MSSFLNVPVSALAVSLLAISLFLVTNVSSTL